ncbi:MAG TPA: glycosyltransferase [Terracidiphilus sp.]|nr:glycosyltransferase [Terracidiphilus sp.]
MNVLLVSYSFPPVGGVGVLRAASLARYLPQHGIRLDVLTARNPSAVGTDPELLNDIPKGVTIHRTLTLDLPFGLKKWIKNRVTGARKPSTSTATSPQPRKPGLLRRIAQDILLPDPQVTWLPILARAAARIVRERNIDLVLITVPPFSSVLLAPKLRARFPNLAIVVDFRDEWLATSIDLISFSRSPRARQIAHQAEAAAVASATAVVAVTEAARRLLQARYPDEPAGKFHLVPNGFDAARLPRVLSQAQAANDKPVLLTYLGTLYGSTEPQALIQAIRTLSEEIRSRLRVRFIGRVEDPYFRQSLLELGETVELISFMPQAQALQALAESDYALLITHDPVNVSAKFYDYLGVGKPIVATVHPGGAVRSLIEELHAGWWADSRDVNAICKLLTDAVTKGGNLSETYRPDVERIATFERKSLAASYAGILHGVRKKDSLPAPMEPLATAVHAERSQR